MGLHLFIYRIKRLMKNKELFFWTAMFPIVLGTLFYLAFGNAMNNNELFHEIPVAVVKQDENENEAFEAFLKEVSEGESENRLLSVSTMTQQEAEEALRKEEVCAVINQGEQIHLTFYQNGTDQTFVKELLDTYISMENLYQKAASEHPEKLQQLISQQKNGMDSESGIEHSSFGSNDLDTYLSFFYALLAMSCLYAANLGLSNGLELKSGQSLVGARRNVSSVSRLKLILADFLAALLLMSVLFCVFLFYFSTVLGVEFGTHLGLIFLAGVFGNMCGLSFGYFVGLLGVGDTKMKNTCVVTSVLFSCFLAGLMIGGMKYIIERNVPIINRINPASLLSDAFYSVSIYEQYDKYWMGIVGMGIYTIIFSLFTLLMMRRDKNDSLERV